MTCQWCGDRHGVDQLCAKAQRGMTRRSFCFLFGAGIAGLTLAGQAPTYKFTGWTFAGETRPRYVSAGVDLAKGADVTAVRIYAGGSGGPHVHIATLPPGVSHMHVGDGLRFTDAAGKPVKPTWLAPSYRMRGSGQ